MIIKVAFVHQLIEEALLPPMSSPASHTCSWQNIIQCLRIRHSSRSSQRYVCLFCANPWYFIREQKKKRMRWCLPSEIVSEIINLSRNNFCFWIFTRTERSLMSKSLTAKVKNHSFWDTANHVEYVHIFESVQMTPDNG